MTGARVVCLGGAGDMGSTLARQLARSPRVGEVVVADFDGSGAERVAGELLQVASCAVSARRIDVLDTPALHALLGECDFLANAAGPFFRLGVPTLEAAIASGTPYLDICDDPEPTRQMLAQGPRATEAGVGAVIGMGASPGLSNLLARRAADRLDTVIDCYTAWPLDGASPGEGEELPTPEEISGGNVSAAVIHLMQQISGEVATVRDGELVHEAPLEPVTLDFPGHGRGTALTVGHPEPLTLHTSLGIRGRATNLMLVKRTTGPFLDSLRRDIDAGRLDLAQAAALLISPGTARGATAFVRAAGAKGPGALPAFFALLRGTRAGETRWVGCCATSLPPGMDGVTAIPAALAIDQLLAKPAPPGVHAPEAVIDATSLLDALLPHCPGRASTVDELAPISESPA